MQYLDHLPVLKYNSAEADARGLNSVATLRYTAHEQTRLTLFPESFF